MCKLRTAPPHRRTLASTWEPSEAITYSCPDGSAAVDGSAISFDPPKRIEMSFHDRRDEEIDAAGPVRMVGDIEPGDGMCRLEVDMRDVEPGGRVCTDFSEGLHFIVSGLKTLLETGTTLTRDDRARWPPTAPVGFACRRAHGLAIG